MSQGCPPKRELTIGGPGSRVGGGGVEKWLGWGAASLWEEQNKHQESDQEKSPVACK